MQVMSSRWQLLKLLLNKKWNKHFRKLRTQRLLMMMVKIMIIYRSLLINSQVYLRKQLLTELKICSFQLREIINFISNRLRVCSRNHHQIRCNKLKEIKLKLINHKKKMPKIQCLSSMKKTKYQCSKTRKKKKKVNMMIKFWKMMIIATKMTLEIIMKLWRNSNKL